MNSCNMKLKRRYARALLLSSLLVSACVAEGGDVALPEVGTTQQELGGTASVYEFLAACPPGGEQKLLDAHNLVTQKLNGAAFQECVKDRFIIERIGHTAEEMIDRLTEQTATHYICVNNGFCGVPGASACVYGSIPSPPDPNYIEAMYVERHHLEAATLNELANTIVHESAHSRGFTHASQSTNDIPVPWSVPNSLGACMDLSIDGYSRAETDGDMELSVIGGDGGQPFMARCPKGERVVGMTVDSSSIINRMVFHCSDGSSSGTVGTYKDSTTTRTTTCNVTVHRQFDSFA